MVSLNKIVEDLCDEDAFDIGVTTPFGPLIHMHKQGYRPKTVLDVGSFQGLWSMNAIQLFTDAKFHLFDPQMGVKKAIFTTEALEELHKPANASRITVHPVLLGAEPKENVPFELLDGGSTVYHELTSFPREVVNLSMVTLDECLSHHTIEGPVFLKLDAQGSELEILKGATKTLPLIDALVIEASTLPYNEGAPLIYDVFKYMDEAGFCLYDFGGIYRRETDKTLFQVDLVFVRKDHPLREKKQFWIYEQ